MACGASSRIVPIYAGIIWASRCCRALVRAGARAANDERVIQHRGVLSAARQLAAHGRVMACRARRREAAVFVAARLGDLLLINGVALFSAWHVALCRALRA